MKGRRRSAQQAWTRLRERPFDPRAPRVSAAQRRRQGKGHGDPAQPQQSEEGRQEFIRLAGEQADMITGHHAALGQRAGPSSHVLTQLFAGQ